MTREQRLTAQAWHEQAQADLDRKWVTPSWPGGATLVAMITRRSRRIVALADIILAEDDES